MTRARLTTTAQLPRKFIRAGIMTKEGRGLFQLLTTTQLYALLQIAWLGPMRQNGFIGFNHIRTLERALARLKKLGFVEYDPEEGYRLAIRWSEDAEMTWIWCWPLAFGHISMKARIMLVFMDEFIDGRYYVKRQELMKAMGVPKKTFHRYLNELKDAGLIVETGRRVGKKGKTLVCARRFNEHFRQLLDDILGGTDYLLRGTDAERELEGEGTPVPATPRPDPRDTPTRSPRHFQEGSPKGSLLGSREKRASPPGESLRQHILKRCNIKDPAYLEQRLIDSQVQEKLNSLTGEEQLIIQVVHQGKYVNHWTDAIRGWDALRYLLDLSPSVGERGEITLHGLHPPHDIELIRALLQAKPDVRSILEATARARASSSC